MLKGVNREFKTSDMHYTLTGLKPNTNYSCAIAAYITKFDGPQARITFTTLMARKWKISLFAKKIKGGTEA